MDTMQNEGGHLHPAEGGMSHHQPWHWACCIMPVVSWVFFAAAIVFTVAAWVSVVKDIAVWNYGAQWWIWNSVMFSLLALFGRHRGHGCSCGRCS